MRAPREVLRTGLAVPCYGAHYRYFPAENFQRREGFPGSTSQGTQGKAGRVRSVSESQVQPTSPDPGQRSVSALHTGPL